MRSKISTILNFDYPKPEYRCRLFYGLNDNSLGYNFLTMLSHFTKQSTLYANAKINTDCLKEKESISNLEQLCFANNILFEYEKSNNSSIDCIINNRRLQCKYSNLIDEFYKFSISKHKKQFNSTI